MNYRAPVTTRLKGVAVLISTLASYGLWGCGGGAGDALPTVDAGKRDAAKRDTATGAGGAAGVGDTAGAGGSGMLDALGAGGSTTTPGDSGRDVAPDVAPDAARAGDAGVPVVWDVGTPETVRTDASQADSTGVQLDTSGAQRDGQLDVPATYDSPTLGQDLGGSSDTLGNDLPSDPAFADARDLPFDDVPSADTRDLPVEAPASADTRDASTGAACADPTWAKSWKNLIQNGWLSGDKEGNLFAANNVITSVDLGGSVGTVTSAGDTDAVVMRFDPTSGNAVWAKRFGDLQAQTATGVAVDKSGHVGFVGTYLGAMTVGTSNLSNLATWAYAYVGALQSDGTALWAISANLSADLGTGAELKAIAANPSVDDFVVCGDTDLAATDLVAGAVAGGGRDIVVAKIKGSDGSIVWSRQIGGTGDQRCTAAAIDDTGDVLIAGNYYGQLDFGGGAFNPAPPSNSRIPWIAKLKGTDGSTVHSLSATRSGTGKATGYVYGIATDAAGNVAIAGTFLSPILFGSTTLTSAGLGDAYVVKLASDLTPSWAMRWGDAQNQEANAVAFDSSGNLTVVGDFFGAINIGPAGGILTAASDTTGSGNDLFVAHLAGSSGNATCALRYGDPLSQSANNVFIPRSAAGTNKDMVFASGSQVQGSVLDFGAAGKFDLPQGDGQGQLWIARF